MGAQGTVSPVRVVLDTNVVVSALIFASGRLHWLRHAWQKAIAVPIVSQSTTLELLRVLTYPKFHLSQIEQEELLAEYLPYCATVAGSEKAEIPHVRDATDRIFLQLAATAQAAYLVTGDVDLLSLATVQPLSPVAIVTPEQLRLALRGLA